jgi:hypothetical protein
MGTFNFGHDVAYCSQSSSDLTHCLQVQIHYLHYVPSVDRTLYTLQFIQFKALSALHFMLRHFQRCSLCYEEPTLTET